MSLRASLLTALAAPIVLVAAVAWATSESTPATQARKVLSDLESQAAAPALSGAHVGDGGLADAPPKAHPSPLAAASAPIAEARKMLARAEELRRLGDPARAELAEDAALEWAETARELVRAIDTEQSADDQTALAAQAKPKAERARALLEEAIARRAKLQADLDALDDELAARALDGGKADAPKAKGTPKKGPIP